MGGWSGSGTFSRTHNWVQDQGNGILIRADRHDANDTDFVNGINNCLTKDGQNMPSANLPMAGYKHTGVANASASDQYAAFGQVLPLSGGALTGAVTSNSAISTTSNIVAGSNSLTLIQSGSLASAQDVEITKTVTSDGDSLGQTSYVNNTNAGVGYGSSFNKIVSAIKGLMVGTGNNSGGAISFLVKEDGGDLLEGMRILGGRTLFIANSSAPATPTGGGHLYVESGALKYKGSSGTVTTLGAA